MLHTGVHGCHINMVIRYADIKNACTVKCKPRVLHLTVMYVEHYKDGDNICNSKKKAGLFAKSRSEYWEMEYRNPSPRCVNLLDA